MNDLAVDLYKRTEWICVYHADLAVIGHLCVCVREHAKPAGVNPCWGHVAFSSTSLSLQCELFLYVWSGYFTVVYTLSASSHSLHSQQFIYMFLVQDSRRVFCHELLFDFLDQFVPFINLFLSNFEKWWFVGWHLLEPLRLGMKRFRFNWSWDVLTAFTWCRLYQTVM